MFGLNQIALYIILGLLAIIGIDTWLISGYKGDIKDLQYSLTVKEVNEKTLKDTIIRMNDDTLQISKEYKARLKEYEVQKPKVITKYVNTYTSNIKGTDCEKVHSILNNIRSSGL